MLAKLSPMDLAEYLVRQVGYLAKLGQLRFSAVLRDWKRENA